MGKDNNKKPKKEQKAVGWCPYHHIQTTAILINSVTTCDQFLGYYKHLTLVKNERKTSVMTVKHIKVDFGVQTLDYYSRVTKFLGNAAEDLGDLFVGKGTGKKIKQKYFTHAPFQNILNQNILSFRVYLLYIPVGTSDNDSFLWFRKEEFNNGKKEKYWFPQLGDGCLVRQHPEWIIDSQDVVFGVHAPTRTTLSSTLARNLKFGDRIVVAVSCVIDPVLDFRVLIPVIPFTCATSFLAKY